MNLQLVVVRANILIMTVLHTETTGNYAQLDKAETFIEMSGMDIAGNNRIKLQNADSRKPVFRRYEGLLPGS